MCFQLLERALRDAQKLDELPTTIPTVSLCDICRHRYRCPSHLRSHAVKFFFRKSSGSSVAGFRKIHGLWPYLQVTIRTDQTLLIIDRTVHLFAPPNLSANRESRMASSESRPVPDSLFATRYLLPFIRDSRLAIRYSLLSS